MALAQKHWALITDACGLTTAGTFGFGVVAQHMNTAAAITLAAAVLLIGEGVMVVTLATHGSLHISAAVAAWAVLATAWTVYAHFHRHVWELATWRWLAFPVIILTAWSILAGHHHVTQVSQIPRPQPDADLAVWHDVFSVIGLDGVHATREWRTDSGRSVNLTLPASGRVTLRTLAAAADQVAVALRVRANAVSFQAGRHAGDVVMRIDDNDTMADDIPYPADDRPLTVTKPFPVGVLPSSKPSVFHGTVSTLITGVTGSGKTNALNVLIAQYVRCPDCIVFVIDLAGGRLAAPWIRPWVEGRCLRPAVDWVATTRGEAKLMLEAVDALVTARGDTLAGGAAKFHPTSHEPHYAVIVDEMADVTGDLPKTAWDGVSPFDMAALGSKATRKVRKEGISLIWATQKGTADFTGSSAIKSECKQRLSLATASESDARAVTDNNMVARLLASAPYAGSAVIESPGSHDAVLTKIWRLDGDDDSDTLDLLATRAGQTRPAPDPLSLTAFGDRYTERWERSVLYQLLLERWHAKTGSAPLPAPPAAPAGQSSAPPAGAPAAVAEMDVNQEAAGIFAASGLGAGTKPDPVGRMWSLLADRPVIGMSVIEITWALEAEGLSVHRSTLYRHLNKALGDGTVRRSGGEGDAARWVLT